MFILTILISTLVSATISWWCVSRMVRQNETWMKKFFSDYRKEYREFLTELRKQRGL